MRRFNCSKHAPRDLMSGAPFCAAILGCDYIYYASFPLTSSSSDSIFFLRPKICSPSSMAFCSVDSFLEKTTFNLLMSATDCHRRPRISRVLRMASGVLFAGLEVSERQIHGFGSCEPFVCPRSAPRYHTSRPKSTWRYDDVYAQRYPGTYKP
jgi:hypothetical protein